MDDKHNKKRKQADDEKPEASLSNSSVCQTLSVTFNPVFHFLYKSPVERGIYNDYEHNNHIPRHAWDNGFALCDRVLIFNHILGGYTGYVAGVGEDTFLLVRLDHIDSGPRRSARIPIHNCKLVPYPQDEKFLRIRFQMFSYLRLDYKQGCPEVFMEDWI